MKVFSWTTMAVTMLALTGATHLTHAQQSTTTPSQSTQSESNRSGQASQPGQAGQLDNDSATGRAGQAPSHQQMDQLIASAVAISNEEEIQLAQLATSRAQSNEVKEFAREMQQQHTELAQKLAQVTGQRINLEGGASGAVIRGQSPDANERSQPNSTNQQDRERSSTSSPQAQAQSQAGQTQPQPGQASQTNQLTHSGTAGHELHQLVQIKREIAQRCLQNTEREMQSLSGNDFDKAYMGHQTVLHGQMLAALQVYQQHASPQLSQTLAQAEQVTERHLQHAKQLCKQLDKSQGGQQERSNTDSDRSSSTNRSQQ